MSDLQEIKEEIRNLRKDFADFRLSAAIDIAKIKVKMGNSSKLWGMVGGGLSSIIVGVALMVLKNSLK